MINGLGQLSKKLAGCLWVRLCARHHPRAQATTTPSESGGNQDRKPYRTGETSRWKTKQNPQIHNPTPYYLQKPETIGAGCLWTGTTKIPSPLRRETRHRSCQKRNHGVGLAKAKSQFWREWDDKTKLGSGGGRIEMGVEKLGESEGGGRGEGSPNPPNENPKKRLSCRERKSREVQLTWTFLIYENPVHW